MLNPLIIPARSTGATVTVTDSMGVLMPGPGHGPFTSLKWSTRNRPRGAGGCPQWIDEVAIGVDLYTATLAASLVAGDTSIASSSRSSRQVNAVLVDAAGAVTGTKYDYAFIPDGALNIENGQLVADKLWLSTAPFDSSIVDPVETLCNVALTP